MRRLDASTPDFQDLFQNLLHSRQPPESVACAVADIIQQVRTRGDDAVRALTKTWDHHELPTNFAIHRDEIERRAAQCPQPLRDAIGHAAQRIRAYHQRALPDDLNFTDAHDNRLGHRWLPVDRAGFYTPGGAAAYPSSVLMNALPAAVAGVPETIMVTPMPHGRCPAAVFAAASEANITTILPIGGAQAIAALAFGTATVPAVDVISGPGNAWVTEAKRQVYGRVGLDALAGPSEVVILAEETGAGDTNEPQTIALDMLAQAEHDPDAQAILITDDPALADAVHQSVTATLPSMPRQTTAAASVHAHGAIILVPTLLEGCALVDQLAPEHLEIIAPDPQSLAAHIRHAGAIFLNTPEAIGDYIAGSNHILPTNRSARFSSGLGVENFLKRTSIIHCSPQGLQALTPDAILLAQSEGLDGHAQSLIVRQNPAPSTKVKPS